MSIPLLQTKLFIPSSQGLISRPRLIDRLEHGRQAGYRLFLVSASAGSGKTSLLSEWASRGDGRFAWLSLDDDDNDPTRFWRYFLAALQQAMPSVGQAALESLSAPQPPPIQAILIPLLNQLAQQEDTVILVLDDYHLISNAEIHTAIAFLLENLPPHIALAIATRADPPLPLFRLRARNQLTEIREASLRFAHAEADRFLKDTMGLDLSPDDTAALEARTEGWIAGLQLAALALKAPASTQDEGQAHAFIADFIAGQHYILEYLAGEVLSRQSQAVQDFLIKTSILERMCAPLCDAVMGTGQTTVSSPSLAAPAAEPPGDSQAILEYLARANLFTVPLDPQRRWRRYHRLFADLLANRRRELLGQREIQELHRRASAWLAHNDLLDEAIRHALAGQDYESTAGLVEQAARPMMFSGQVNSLRNWLAALPPAAFDRRPRLKIYRVWIELLQGRSELTPGTIQEAENLLAAWPPSPEKDELTLELNVVLCRIVALMGDTRRAIQMAEGVLEELPEGDLASRARAYSALAIAYGMEGQADRSERAYWESLRLAQAASYDSLAAHTTMVMASGLTYIGQLRQAAQAYRSIIDMGAASGQQIFYPAGQGYIGLADIHLEWNDIETCEEFLGQGIELCSQAGLAGVETGVVIQARLRQAKGDLSGALAELDSLAPGFQFRDPACIARRIRILLAMGDVQEAARLAQPLAAILAASPPFPYLPLVSVEFFQALVARVYLAQGKIEQAIQVLEALQTSAQAGQRHGPLIDVYLLRALATVEQADGKISPTALELFKHALALAEPEGYVLRFVEEGPTLIPLLKAVVSRPAAPERLKEYAYQLLQTFPGGAESSPLVDGMVEPLSQRELEVLRLICEGCSNQEIAERLVVTLHTVKKHNSNIYSKLGVNSRTQAISRARELGLL